MLGFSVNKFAQNYYVHIRKILIPEMVHWQVTAGLKENALSPSRYKHLEEN